MSCQFWQPGVLEYLHPTHPQVIGVGEWWWKESRQCHQCLLLSNNLNNHTTKVLIADYCPECTPRQLDLNDKASAKLSSKNRPENYYNLTAREIPCQTINSVPLLFRDKGSSIYHWYLIPLNIKHPLKNITLPDKNSAEHDKYGRWILHFNRSHKPYYSATACDPISCFSINVS